MDYGNALKQIEHILNDLDEAAYQQGYKDCKAEMQSEITKAKDESYAQGYQDGIDKED